MELIVFQLNQWRFALPLADVHEIVQAVTVVPLPTAPTVVLGVIDVRGVMVPVLDVRERFGLLGRYAQVTDHFVLATAGTRLVALCVDRALEIRSVDDVEVVDAAALAPGVRLVRGVFKDSVGLVLVHQLEAFLSADEELVLATALAGGART